jgi:hypothetical protein
VGEDMKESFIVFYHYQVLGEAVVKAYSSAQAQYTMEQRLKKKGRIEPKIDSVMSEKEEQAINDNRER